MDNQRQTRLRSQTSVKEVLKLKFPKAIRGFKVSEDEPVEDRVLPVLRVENKRKRGVRGAGRRHKQSLEFQKETNEKLLEYENVSENNVELKTGEKDGYSSAGEALSTAASPSEREFSTDIFEEPKVMRQQGDKRRESSRLRVKPSKFRESLPATIVKQKDQKGSDDVSSSLEFFLPMDVQNPSAGQSLTHLDSEIDKPSQTEKRQIKGSQRPSRSSETLGSAHESSSSPRKGFEGNGLKAALAVVKRVMQIKSAEPFNEPVDPVALEIPDYLDVIKEPMDLGTIRVMLEAGTKYSSAHEVFEDVQLVWSNCRKYNQEGDPIMDIMRTAETVFNRHWNAAGLQDYMSYATNRSKSIQEETNEEDSGEEDEMEEDEEDEDPRTRKSKEPGGAAKLKSVKIVHFDTPPSRTKAKRSEMKQHADVELQSEPEARTPVNDKDASSHDSPPPSSNKRRGSPPSSKRRTFGTAHHKPDCICVVCLGRRRKLAKLALEQGDKDGDDEQQVDEIIGSAVVQERKAKKVIIKVRTSEKTGKKSEIPGSVLTPSGTAGDLDPVLPDMHMGEASDPEPVTVTSTPKVEEGTQYYPANHELPLRKASAAVLQMSHYLFGPTMPSLLGRHNSRGYKAQHSATKSRMLEAVGSLAWSDKKAGQV